MTDEQKQWRRALAAKAARRRRHTPRPSRFKDIQVGIRWTPHPAPEPTRPVRRGV